MDVLMLWNVWSEQILNPTRRHWLRSAVTVVLNAASNVVFSWGVSLILWLCRRRCRPWTQRAMREVFGVERGNLIKRLSQETRCGLDGNGELW